ncbi:helix-turn-helix transcriptional regulator [Chryseobacterium oryzae]|uniref:WYL domain-containing protein n=1 Tax=Chryseobacterium oryzae TaxID=2929799 RepID=A0ABY4BEY5_9FLAO|nr:WYL domain-containing protein [Chryseobacterium oryzae]UOE37677.1 WYL domain-containing protein [Chryseobacterium oryzae]
MAQVEQIYRFMMLADLFKRKKNGVSYKEAYDFLEKEFDKKGFELKFSEKTFKRDRTQIFELLEMESSYSRTDKNFKITEREYDLESENIVDNVLLIDAYRQTKGKSGIMLFQKRKARGLDHLNGLLHAIQNRKIISFDYHKFWEEKAEKRVVESYALKEFNDRWYLLANEKHKEGFLLKTFGLDRISALEIHHSTFKRQEIDAEEIFRNSFGIISTYGENPQKILLSFDAVQGKYIKSLPLHYSQEVVSENKEKLVIKLFLVPTFDFIQEILSHSELVEVISPKSLRNEVKDRIDMMREVYSK